jgi:hypothetical protein
MTYKINVKNHMNLLYQTLRIFEKHYKNNNIMDSNSIEDYQDFLWETEHYVCIDMDQYAYMAYKAKLPQFSLTNDEIDQYEKFIRKIKKLQDRKKLTKFWLPYYYYIHGCFIDKQLIPIYFKLSSKQLRLFSDIWYNNYLIHFL